MEKLKWGTSPVNRIHQALFWTIILSKKKHVKHKIRPNPKACPWNLFERAPLTLGFVCFPSFLFDLSKCVFHPLDFFDWSEGRRVSKPYQLSLTTRSATLTFPDLSLSKAFLASENRHRCLSLHMWNFSCHIIIILPCLPDMQNWRRWYGTSEVDEFSLFSWLAHYLKIGLLWNHWLWILQANLQASCFSNLESQKLINC